MSIELRRHLKTGMVFVITRNPQMISGPLTYSDFTDPRTGGIRADWATTAGNLAPIDRSLARWIEQQNWELLDYVREPVILGGAEGLSPTAREGGPRCGKPGGSDLLE